MRKLYLQTLMMQILAISILSTCLYAETITISVPDQYYATGSIMSSDQINWSYDGEGDIGYARPAIHAGFMFANEHRGFAWFDISSIPGGAVILDIELDVFCTQNSLNPTQMVNLSSMTVMPEPGSENAAMLANSMIESYYEGWNVMQQVGFHSVNLNDMGIAMLQNSIEEDSGFIGIGFIGENQGEIPDGSIGGFSDPNPPAITITYVLGESGDVNNDNELNVLDIIQIVSFILGTAEPDGYEAWAADFNNDGSINIMDILSIINCIVVGC